MVHGFLSVSFASLKERGSGGIPEHIMDMRSKGMIKTLQNSNFKADFFSLDRVQHLFERERVVETTNSNIS